MKTFLFRKIIIILCLFGIVVSATLVFHHTSIASGYQTGPSFCSLSNTFNCDLIARSSYSSLFGIPTASYSLVYYLAMLIFSFVFKPGVRIENNTFVDSITAASFFALIPSVFLGYISFFMLKSICLFCAILYCNSIVLAIVSVRVSRDSYSLLNSIKKGSIAIIKLPITLTILICNSHDRKLSVVASVVLFFGLSSAVYLGPEFLDAKMFLPAKLKAESELKVKAFVDKWKSNKAYEFVLIDSSNGSIADFVKGSKDAQVTIVEFSDFECPFCKRASAIMDSLLVKYRGKVRVVFKNYPLDNSCNPAMDRKMHPLACRAAKMSVCAGVQDSASFWKMHDAIFSLFRLSEDKLKDIPVDLGLDVEEFNVCMEGAEAQKKILEDIKLATKLHVNSTPAVYVDGKKLEAFNEVIVNAAVDSLLSSSGIE